ncbi:hypothetical protein HDU76_003934 [Blyttiomyces sp. JEL0837]|nr:hypothetical protein HDU76_003934 [Blyttiomyces sp. JEL0837]
MISPPQTQQQTQKRDRSTVIVVDDPTMTIQQGQESESKSQKVRKTKKKSTTEAVVKTIRPLLPAPVPAVPLPPAICQIGNRVPPWSSVNNNAISAPTMSSPVPAVSTVPNVNVKVSSSPLQVDPFGGSSGGLYDLEHMELMEEAKRVEEVEKANVKKRRRPSTAKNAVTADQTDQQRVTTDDAPKPKRVKKDKMFEEKNRVITAALVRKSLPPDILFNIISFAIYVNGEIQSMRPNSFLFLQRFGTVCKDWRGAMFHHQVWKEIAERFSMGEIRKNANLYKTYYQLVTIKHKQHFCHVCMSKVETRKGSSKIILPFDIGNNTILRTCLSCRTSITRRRINSGVWRSPVNGVNVVFKKKILNQGQSMDKYRLVKADLFGVGHKTVVRRASYYNYYEYIYNEAGVFEAALLAHGGIEGLILLHLPVPSQFVPAHLQAKYREQERERERERAGERQLVEFERFEGEAFATDCVSYW